MALGNKIQSLREAQGLSQKELANRIGVTTGTIAEWEADEASPALAELARLRKTLGVSSDALLDTVSEPSPYTAEKPNTVSHKKPGTAAWVIGIAILCIAIIITAVVLLVKGDNNKTDSADNADVAEPLPFSEDTAAIEEADASVVTVFCYDYNGELAATGSGFVAFDGQTVITNYHVMSSAYTCKISTNQDISYDVSGIYCYSKEQDIAILQLAEDTGLTPLTLGDSKAIKKGEAVVAIGSPLGIKNTVSTGVLSGRLMEDNMDVLQFTAPISSGSSGGALFDDNGNVIGITFASFVDGQNLNLAIPIELAVEYYNNKESVKDASRIYLEEHPYVSILDKYKNIPEITVEELLNNPSKYKGKTVKVYGYISSLYSYHAWSSLHLYHCYISSANNVTGDYKYDSSMFDAGRRKEKQFYTMYVDLTSTAKERIYLPLDASPGDRICCVGIINYQLPKKTLDLIDFSIDIKLIYSLE